MLTLENMLRGWLCPLARGQGRVVNKLLGTSKPPACARSAGRPPPVEAFLRSVGAEIEGWILGVIGAIRAMPYIAHTERKAHAQKTKRGDQEGHSDPEIKVGWSESSKKEGKSHR